MLCFQCHFSLILAKVDYILSPCRLLLSFFEFFFLWCSVTVFSCPFICSCSFLLISCFCDQSMFLVILTIVFVIFVIFLFLIFKINSLVTLHLLWFFLFFSFFFRLNLCLYFSFVKESPSKARFQRFYSQIVYHQNGSIVLGYVTINYI